MGIGLVADKGSVFIEKEVTEGVYVAESAGAKAVEVLSDGLEFTPTKELLERNNRTATVEKVPSRIGQKSMACTVPTEFKAHHTEGNAPETNDLYEALLGGKDTLTASTTKAVGNTASVLQIEDADISKYKKNYIVKVKIYDATGGLKADHVSPIKSVDSTGGAANIELLVPYTEAMPDSVEIAPATIYYHKSGAPTLSLTNYHGGEIREKAIGERCVNGELANFATGQLPTMSFGLEGLDFEREVGQPLFTPEYDLSLPPVVLCSKVYKDDSEVIVNNVGMTMTNTLGFLTSTASCRGKIGSRITEFVTTFTLNPYMEDDNVNTFDLFNDNEAFSLFGSSYNPDTTKDEFKEVVAFYMPNCRIPELTTGNEDGILTDQISGQAYKSDGNDTVYIAFI
jgi:hypothetical protein